MTTRKQYSSCDQCRRSKRKCTAFSGDERSICLNCSTRGRTCTFEFAKFHPRQRFRKHKTWDTPARGDEQVDANGAQALISTPDEEHIANDVSGETEHGWLGDFSFDGFGGLAFSNGNAIDSNSFFLTDEQADVNENSDPAWTGNYRHSQPALPELRNQQQYKTWKGSPMQLLNSTYSKMLMDECLGEIYESVIFGLESRYLDHACNVLRPKSRYRFVDEKHGDRSTADMTPVLSIQSSTTCTPSHEPTSSMVSVTFIGLARFLDHFGALYGNKMTAYSKSEDEKLFLAAQQAFALQWFACENAGVRSTAFSHRMHMFGDAWNNVEQTIRSGSSHVSFVRLYALLLFHTTGIPVNIRHSENEKNDLLMQIASELSVLKELVGRFCDNLPSTSRYRTLLDTAVKVFEWFTYIKDTTASLLHDRKSILPDFTNDPVDESGYDSCCAYSIRTWESAQEVFWPSSIVTDDAPRSWEEAEILASCQKATVHTFELFRQILHLKECLRDFSPPSSEVLLLGQIDSAIELVDCFYLLFSELNSHCSSQSTNLSDASKLSYCFMMFFWVCGVLSFVEQVQRASDLDFANEINATYSKLIEYEETAVASGIATCHAFIAASINGQASLSKNSMTKLPYIAHHVNLSLVVEVLQKLVEHVIESDILKVAAFDDEGLVQASPLKPLLCCLSDLEATLAGASMARRVRERLMQCYGDILLECWTVDD